MNESNWRKRIHACDASTRADALAELATAIRVHAIRTIHEARLGHVGGDFSVADVLAVMFGAVLRMNPERPDEVDRDRFILSKGHAAASLYSAMALVGYFDIEELGTFAKADSRLGGHPDRRKLPGIETNTGPLGHGLPVAVGIALGAKITGRSFRTFVATGDGELQEGSNWEAIMFAGHRALENLTLIVDCNGLQQGARVSDTNTIDPLEDRLRAFGWEVSVVGGHDHEALYEALISSSLKPHAIVARTVKGRGVSFMEDRVEWHHRVPTEEQVLAALEELGQR